MLNITHFTDNRFKNNCLHFSKCPSSSLKLCENVTIRRIYQLLFSYFLYDKMALLYNLQRLHLYGLKVYERIKRKLNEQRKNFDQLVNFCSIQRVT